MSTDKEKQLENILADLAWCVDTDSSKGRKVLATTKIRNIHAEALAEAKALILDLFDPAAILLAWYCDHVEALTDQHMVGVLYDDENIIIS